MMTICNVRRFPVKIEPEILSVVTGVVAASAVAQVALVEGASNVGGAVRIQQRGLLLRRRGRGASRQRARHGGSRRQGRRVRAARCHQSGPSASEFLQLSINRLQ